MRNCEFEIGDLVQLKSGSPRMMVCGIERTSPVWYHGVEAHPAQLHYKVTWMVYGTSEVKEAQFDHRLLVPAVDDRRNY